MPDTIERSPELQPLLALLDRQPSGSMPEWRAEALWRLRQLQAEAQPILKQKADDFDQLCQAALRGEADPEEMEHAAGILAERERAQAEQLVPEIEALQLKLVAGAKALDPELRNGFQAGIDIAVAWLAQSATRAWRCSDWPPNGVPQRGKFTEPGRSRVKSTMRS
jgi:hypothetical protein